MKLSTKKGRLQAKNVCSFKHFSRNNFWDLELLAHGLHTMKSSCYSFQVTGSFCCQVLKNFFFFFLHFTINYVWCQFLPTYWYDKWKKIFRILIMKWVTNSLRVQFFLYFIIGQLPRVSVEDRERKRVDSVFKTSACLSVCSLIVCKFSHFLYYKVL